MTQAMPPEVLERCRADPSGRIASPDDVAGILAFLASSEAAYITARCSSPAAGGSVAP